MPGLDRLEDSKLEKWDKRCLIQRFSNFHLPLAAAAETPVSVQKAKEGSEQHFFKSYTEY